MDVRSWRGLAVVLIIVVLSAVGASAESGTKSLIINPNPKSDLQVRLWTDKGTSDPSYRVGENVQLYFEVSENAYVTIFDINAAGKVTKLFPNSHQPDNYARKNRIYRVPDKYDIIAAPPTGEENLLIVATRNKPIDYPELLRENGLERLLSRLQRRLSLSGEDWAMDLCVLRIEPARRQTITYDVQSNLWGVKLFVDGSYVGELPQKVELGPGEHQLVALKSGYKAAIRNVYVDKNSKDGRWMVRLDALKSQPSFSGEGHLYLEFDIKL
ncbi:MAG: DUF4384 domain-containing protein [Firmicutes bacterium]|nr:DUF4384 domain-containing protein [Bacillota bacterium]